MPVVSIISDPATLTLTATGEYAVPLERLWAAWTTPQLVERFWGPPQWPATFTRFDLMEGGKAEYHMSGPNGEVSHGYWTFVSVEAPRSFAVDDGFANPDGTPNTDLPQTRMRLRFEVTPTGSRFVAVSTFPSVEAMEGVLAMGMVEGLTAALAQMDDVLADLRDHADSMRTALQVVDDTHVVVTREVRGSLLQVWRCHHEADLVRRWLLGPPGWVMPICRVAQAAERHLRVRLGERPGRA